MAADRASRILIVDDEPALRALLVRALQAEGFEVVSPPDGLAGRDAAVTANAPFDLMITNTHMPRMNGAELVAEVRAAFPGLPILHLDDLSRPDHGALPADVPNLYKPFRLEALVDRVKSLLESRLAE